MDHDNNILETVTVSGEDKQCVGEFYLTCSCVTIEKIDRRHISKKKNIPRYCKEFSLSLFD